METPKLALLRRALKEQEKELDSLCLRHTEIKNELSDIDHRSESIRLLINMLREEIKLEEANADNRLLAGKEKL